MLQKKKRLLANVLSVFFMPLKEDLHALSLDNRFNFDNNIILSLQHQRHENEIFNYKTKIEIIGLRTDNLHCNVSN